MRETPEILAISDALGRPPEKYRLYGVASIAGVAAAILAATNHSHAAVRTAALGFIALIVGCNVIIWKCGTLLLATIDKSLQNTSAAVNSTQTSPIHSAQQAEGGRVEDDVTEARGRQGAGRDSNMVAARKHIETCLVFCLAPTVVAVPLLVFAVASSYGTVAPMLFFGYPFGFGPHQWFFLNVQIHAGRSKPRVSPGVRSPGGSRYECVQSRTSGS